MTQAPARSPRRIRRPRPATDAAAVKVPIRQRLDRSRARGAEVWERSLAPRAEVVSPIGWAILLGAVLCWTAGLLLRVTELNVVAVMLTVPLLVAAIFVLGRSAYRVTLDLSTHRVVVGERAIGTVQVANDSPRVMMPSRIELEVGDATAQFLVPRLRPEASHEEIFAIPTRRREVLVVGPVRSVRDDPLGLMRRQVTWAREQEVYVHPRTVRLDGFETGYLRDLEGTPSSALSSSDIAFHALREYVSGDDRRHVHWKTTARTGTLMVRQFEETRRSHVVVALTNAAAHFDGDDEFELAVSVAASLSAQTLREEKELTALSIDGRQRIGSYRQLMDDYTVIEGVRARHALRDLGRAAAEAAPSASAVMLVVGSQATPTELNAAAAQLPPGVIAIAVRCESGQSVHRSHIGSLELVTLGAIEQLPRAMRAVSR